jgi:UDP-N-acetylglucosamine 3-dehydrogenase
MISVEERQEGTLRVGVLGAGFMGETHARCYAALREAEVAKIYAPSETRAMLLAEELDAACTNDIDEVLSDESIQVVSVCLPTPQHPEAATKALEAGKHVLCEKPLALSEEEGRHVFAVAERSDRTLMVGHVLRFWPEYIELHRLVSSGELGRPVTGFASRRSTFPTWSELYRNPELTGGTVLDLQIHDLDVLNWIFGEAGWVQAEGVENPGSRGRDHNVITVGYEGAFAVAEGSIMMPPSYPFSATLRVLCEKGLVEYGFKAVGSGVETGAASGTGLIVYPEEGEPRSIAVEQVDPYQSQIDYFVECVRHRTRPERVSPQDALSALRVALAAGESMQRGARISVS